MADSLLQVIERMFDARIPADGRRAPRHQYNESGGENFDAEHDRFRDLVVVVVDGLVIMAKMEDELMGVVMAIVCVLMTKNLMTLIKKRGLMGIYL